MVIGLLGSALLIPGTSGGCQRGIGSGKLRTLALGDSTSDAIRSKFKPLWPKLLKFLIIWPWQFFYNGITTTLHIPRISQSNALCFTG